MEEKSLLSQSALSYHAPTAYAWEKRKKHILVHMGRLGCNSNFISLFPLCKYKLPTHTKNLDAASRDKYDMSDAPGRMGIDHTTGLLHF